MPHIKGLIEFDCDFDALAEELERNGYVKVVRCKDCKHYVLYELFGRSQGWCERLCDKFDKSLARGTEDDDFCSHGERRETDEREGV